MRLGIPISELQAKTTSWEFLEWLQIIEEDSNIPSRADFYAMQIAQVVAQVNSKKGVTVSIKKFILKFTAPVLHTAESYLQKSKRNWGMILGLDLEKETKKK